MSVFGLPATCPRCGTDFTLVNGTSNGSLAVAILGCTACGREWECTARLTPMAASERNVRRHEQRHEARTKA